MVAVRATERGAGVYNDSGAHGLQEGRWAREGPIEMALRNQHVRPEDLFFFFFFFGDHLISTGKTVRISVKTFFFGDHIIIRTKLRHFLRLFWSSQNRKSVLFELAPGQRSALGTPGSGERRYEIEKAKIRKKRSCHGRQFIDLMNQILL